MRTIGAGEEAAAHFWKLGSPVLGITGNTCGNTKSL